MATVTISKVTIDGLRALRLWHWQQAMAARQQEKDAKAGLIAGDWEALDKLVGFHIKHVQTLNDFFPFGDTAEHDEDKRQAVISNG